MAHENVSLLYFIAHSSCFPEFDFFFSFRAGLQWTGIVPYKKTSVKEREIEHHIFSDF